MTALVTKNFVHTSNRPYSEGPLQSKCCDRLPMALSLHRVSLQNEFTVPGEASEEVLAPGVHGLPVQLRVLHHCAGLHILLHAGPKQ